MSERNGKSNAPWILGIVGFGLSIPQIVCSILCAASASSVADVAAELGDKGAATSASATGLVAMLPVIFTVACFILSFFGKSSFSKVTGILTILLALSDIVACAVNFSAFGIAAAICFFCAGISSICNSKK